MDASTVTLARRHNYIPLFLELMRGMARAGALEGSVNKAKDVYVKHMAPWCLHVENLSLLALSGVVPLPWRAPSTRQRTCTSNTWHHDVCTFSEQPTFINVGCSQHTFCMGRNYFGIYSISKIISSHTNCMGGNLINICRLLTERAWQTQW